MCGISGFFGVDLDSALRAVERMNRAQRHRGPDDEGLEKIPIGDRHLVFGHRRLSILDPTPAGHQPMQNPATGDWITYNGEIYNYPDLRAQLEAAGHRFATRCDTEVILKAFEQWGTDCFGHLRGMFALALYDARNRRLVLARDPLGIKPLYCFKVGRAFAFASEVRALLATGLVPRDVNRRALASLLAYGAVQAPDTIFQNVRLFPPATFAIADLSADEVRLDERTFWNFPAPSYASAREGAVAEVRTLLAQSVRSHLLSDVPVAVFLSRGMDSTAVAALAAQASGDPIDAFTVAMRERPEMDESAEAAAVAQAIGIRHKKILLSEDEVRQQTLDFLKAVDQPTVDGLNTYIISKAVRDHGFKVALSGLGGDEVFGGYDSFRRIPSVLKWAQVIRAVPRPVRTLAAWTLYLGKSGTQRLKAAEMAQTPVEVDRLYFRRRRLFSDRELAAFGFSAGELGLTPDFVPPESHPERCLVAGAPESSIGNLESRYYMGNMLLRDTDALGMAHGLEIRVPLLDTALVNFVATLPGRWRAPDRDRNKPLLADAMAGVLPNHLARRPKQGFTLPIAHWMAGPLREEFEARLDTVSSVNLLDPRLVKRTWGAFLDSPDGNTWARAWQLVVLASFLS